MSEASRRSTTERNVIRMYVPAEYQMKDQQKMIQFIRKHSFGVLFSQQNGLPHGTHLPFLIETGADGDLYLVSHMSRANPQWRSIDSQVLTVFSGPHAYVSPTWYEQKGFVPTWDYMAVHVYGEFMHVDDAEGLRTIMEQTITYYESGMDEPWDGQIPDHIYHRLIQGVMGFKIKITDMQAQWKLHQDHSPERRNNVIRHLKKTGEPDALKIAEAIKAANPDNV
ncbi:FMN-binding negative transcriptional regulator [Paenibacillus sp. MABNR03]|uniref:FMN-binding negative transcriptional regulator n=1 Tax=Paenibacillus sp. MABNR03 TaxID=3142626 RepID=UPI003D2961D7